MTIFESRALIGLRYERHFLGEFLIGMRSSAACLDEEKKAGSTVVFSERIFSELQEEDYRLSLISNPL